MNTDPKLIPTSSQTAGPFFRLGLDYLIECAPSPGPAHNTITIRGRVFDRDRAPVPDAMLEFWSPAETAASNAHSPHADFPSGFARAATDADGNYCVLMNRPVAVTSGNGASQAPHVLVLVFARGLLRHLISRVYFDGQPDNHSDLVLCAVPADRRRTLIARSDQTDSFSWDIILQGPDETVFFAW